MENWIKVLEFNRKVENTMEWLFKLLEEEKIPYKEETKEEWVGIGKYARYNQNTVVYVPKEYKEKVESYLKEYKNPNNIVYEDAKELKNAVNDYHEEEKEYNKRKIAQKILTWIPIGFILIIIICGMTIR